METIQFKTNIKCAGCVANVTSELNKVVGENNWNVDTQSTDKILTIAGTCVRAEVIQAAVEKVGYNATIIE